GRDKVLVDLQREGYDGVQPGEHRQGHEYVVQQGDDGTQRIPPVAEPDEDIDEDDQDGEDRSLYRAGLEIGRDGGLYLGAAFHEAYACGGRGELFVGRAFGQDLFDGPVNGILDGRVGAGTRVV